MLSTGVGVLLVSKVGVLEDNIEIELLEEEERERTTPIVAFDFGFLTQENADTFPILICRYIFSFFCVFFVCFILIFFFF